MGPWMTDLMRSRFLVVDDDVAVRRAIARIVRRHGESVAAATLQDAVAILRDGSVWTGFVFDVQLPDGSGLDLLAQARAAHPMTPAMVLTGNMEKSVVNAAYDLRARCVIKPVVTERIEQFLRDAVSLDRRVGRSLEEWVWRYGLSEAEANLLRRAALGESKGTIAARRDTSKETIRKQVASLLAKTGDDSLQGAANRVLRDVARA